MLLEFSIKNFRSIKDEQFITMIPDTGKKSNKVESTDSWFEYAEGKHYLTSAVVYGANAAGKSNFLKAMQLLREVIRTSESRSPNGGFGTIATMNGSSFSLYDPFVLPEEIGLPCELDVAFLINKVQYKYHLAFNEKEVLEESLYFHPQGKEAKLFHREKQEFTYGDYLKGQRVIVANLTNENQLYLSKGANNNIEQLKEVYDFLVNQFMPIPFLDSWFDSYYSTRISEELKKGKDYLFVKAFTALVPLLDAEIKRFRVAEEGSPKEFRIFAVHEYFDDGINELVEKELSIEEESAGTQKLFVLVGLILRALTRGRVLVVDEFERSLHPHISAFLIRLFNDPQINKKGAQLILATHDISLLGEQVGFRRDQIWIAEKEHGTTSLTPFSDIEGLRSEAPLEKWYRSGRLGGIPNIGEFSFKAEFEKLV